MTDGGGAVLITARNAMSVCGMSFQRVCTIARVHGVPVIPLGARAHAVPAQAWLAAVRATVRAPEAMSLVDRILYKHTRGTAIGG